MKSRKQWSHLLLALGCLVTSTVNVVECGREEDVLIKGHHVGGINDHGACVESMFTTSMDDDNVVITKPALHACQAQFALQRNWFPDPIAGLFSYQTWNGMDGFWQDGIAIETMVNAMHYGNHSRYFSVVKSSLREVSALEEAYAPYPSFDDMAWYGLAYAKVHELLGLEGFLRVAKDLFNWCWDKGWDSSGRCGGGVYFDQNFNAKATIENAQLYALGMKLARFSTRDKAEREAFISKAEKLWNFLTKATGLLDPASFKLYDGINMETCQVDDKKTTYTYTAGTLAGGLVEEFQLKKDPQLLLLAHNISQSVISHLTRNGVLTELCDPNDACSLDARAFKGIFVRNLRYLIDATQPFKQEFNRELQAYQKFLDRNVKALLTNASCTPSSSQDCHIVYLDGPPAYNKTGPVFGAAWNLPMKEARPMAHSSALDLLNAAIPDGIICQDQDLCSFDPPNPPPVKLTCEDNPCPLGQDCCEFEQTSFTCCAPSQHCDSGYCI